MPFHSATAAHRTSIPASRSVLAVAVSLACLAAQAQETQSLETVTVTGSRIKRLEDAPALPVQSISREDILDSGVSTAAELLKSVSAMTAPLTDGASITDSTSGQRGFNGANLRGIGVSGTLVLLNGRRMANFASPGDAAGVDLNNIPAGAIEHVEVQKDGASAIYGTDAIGGVINFITRTDYEGLDASVYAAAGRARPRAVRGGAATHGPDSVRPVRGRHLPLVLEGRRAGRSRHRGPPRSLPVAGHGADGQPEPAAEPGILTTERSTCEDATQLRRFGDGAAVSFWGHAASLGAGGTAIAIDITTRL